MLKVKFDIEKAVYDAGNLTGRADQLTYPIYDKADFEIQQDVPQYAKIDLNAQLSPCTIAFSYESQNHKVQVFVSQIHSLPSVKNSSEQKSPKKVVVAFENPTGHIYLCLRSDVEQKVSVKVLFPKRDNFIKTENLIKSSLPNLSELYAPPMVNDHSLI